MNTSIKQKARLWPVFLARCKSQWVGGGKRYALTDEKEFTDLVCEVGRSNGTNWIGQNIVKYVGEIINAREVGEKPQEVNFFKIAVYAFLWWIKYHSIGFSHKDTGEDFDLDKLKMEE